MIRWIVPGNFPATTGAMVFGRRLAAVLGRAGEAVRFDQLGGQHPMPDAAARAEAARLIAEMEADATIPRMPLVIDGFCFYAFAGLGGKLSRALIMLHHAMSAEPQLPEGERRLFETTERDLLPHVRQIAVPSEAGKRYLVETIGINPAKITVLTPGVPRAARSVGSGGAGCHLLAVASLIPRKGYETVLRALERLPDLDWSLTICGDATVDPGHAGYLMQLSTDLGIGHRLRFLGPQSDAEMEALWQSADVFVSGSIYEGYGMAVAEAVRHGLPLAITRGAAAPEVIPELGSAIVEPGDAVQLSKALRRLIFDPAVRQALSEASWQAGQALPDWGDQAALFRALVEPGAIEEV
ncbi:glycosyltransferase family 4 protein [Acidisoma sp. C75]